MVTQSGALLDQAESFFYDLSLALFEVTGPDETVYPRCELVGEPEQLGPVRNIGVGDYQLVIEYRLVFESLGAEV